MERRNEAITAVKDAYFYKVNSNLPIYGIPTSQYKLQDFVQTEHDAKKGQETLPGTNFRLFVEDIGTRPLE